MKTNDRLMIGNMSEDKTTTSCGELYCYRCLDLQRRVDELVELVQALKGGVIGLGASTTALIARADAAIAESINLCESHGGRGFFSDCIKCKTSQAKDEGHE